MRILRIALLAVAILALMPMLVLAQAGNGSISGTVSDPTGAVIPNANVTVTNLATSTATHVTTTSDGRYTALQLRPGNYQLVVESKGFKRYVSSGLVVQVDDKLALNITLDLGSATETVTVTGEAPALRAEDAQTGEVVNNNFVMSLPQINRDPFALLRVSGNVQGAEKAGSTADIRMNGGRTSSIDFYVDGQVVTSGRGHSLSSQTPSMDAVQEFKVVTNGISAEYGRISGGYVQLVSKSGTNEYHGNLYEYMFNDMFNANGWYQNALGNKKVHFRQNDYGFTLGGPVRIPKLYDGRNKTFFFVDNEYFRYNQAGAMVVSSVPTTEERQGNFTNTVAGGLATMMYDPNGAQSTTPNADGTYTRLDLLGGNGKIVPASQIAPTSAAILALLPASNRPTAGGFSSLNNYAAPQNNTRNNFRFGTRLDHSISDTQRVNFSYTTYNSNGGQSRTLGPLSTASTQSTEGGLRGNLNYDWAYKPTLLFNMRAAMNHSPYTSGQTLPSDVDIASLKLNPVITQILGSKSIPTIQKDFQSGGYYGTAPSSATTVSTTYDFAFTGTKVANRHTVKFGWEHRRYYDNFYNMGGSNVVTFTGNPVAQTTGDHGFGSSSSLPNSLGSLLLGINSRAQISGPTTRAMNLNYDAGFVQDDFKVNSKLTLNLGVRWDREGPTTERHDKIYFWNPDAPSMFSINSGYSWTAALAAAGLPTTLPTPSWVNGMPRGAVQIPNTPEFTDRNFQRVNSHQFAPRLGAAYQLNQKTVLRASAGLMYLPTTGDANGFSSSNASMSLSSSANAGWHASTDGQRHYISSWANPFPLDGMITNYTRNTLLANKQSSADPGVSAFNRDVHMPREYTWMASVQRELPVGFVFEAGYSGNRGLGLLAPNLISRYPAELFTQAYAPYMTKQIASPQAGQTLSNTITGTSQLLGILMYPYPQYGPVVVLGSNLGASTFHAMNVRLEHRLSHGLSFLLNYTYSHQLDDVGGPEAATSGGMTSTGNGGKTPQSIYTFASTWGLSANDQPHRLTLTYLYELPFGRGHRWLGKPNGLGQAILDRVAGGWQISGMSTYVSGRPVTWWGTATVNTNNSIKVETTYGSYATSDHNLGNPLYTNDAQVLYSPAMSVTASTVGRFAANKMVTAQPYIIGNLPPVDSKLRNPSYYQTDLSLMKNFSLGSEKRYLQIRAEGQNAFNIRGYGSYNNKLGDPYFGLITSAGNNPRQIQVSARLIF